MTGWSDPGYYTDGNGRRWRANQGLKALMASANRVLATPRYGSEREPMNWYQGSKSSGSLSGNTHAGWDAYDRTPFNKTNRNRCMRIHGVADWNRTRAQGPWVPHGHGIVDGGDPSAAGQVQIASYHRNDNGLRGNAADDGFKMRNSAGNRVFPLFVAPWKATGKPGKFECITECGGYQYQSTAAPRLLTVKVGMVLSISGITAVVNSSGKHYWGITDKKGDTPGGEVVYLGNLKRVS